MEVTSQIERLEPEIQTLIMCHIPKPITLLSLLHASPRFFQVFRSRRNYHLTQLAVRHGRVPANTGETVKASALPRPPSPVDVEEFLRTYLQEAGFKAAVLEPQIAIAMIKLEHTVE